MSILSAQTGWWRISDSPLPAAEHANKQVTHAAKRPPPLSPRIPKNAHFCSIFPYLLCTKPVTLVHHTWNLPCLSQTLLKAVIILPCFLTPVAFCVVGIRNTTGGKKGPILIKRMYRHATKDGTAPSIPSVLVLLNEVLNGWPVPSLSALQELLIS